jgi:solute carrier family 41
MDRQHWPLFIDISEMFILVPALLGLKGNLEMTFASRLSTAANMGELDSLQRCRPLLVANLMLVQVVVTRVICMCVMLSRYKQL